MKNYVSLGLKFIVGYMINSIGVAIICFGLSQWIGIGLYDSLLIAGVIITGCGVALNFSGRIAMPINSVNVMGKNGGSTIKNLTVNSLVEEQENEFIFEETSKAVKKNEGVIANTLKYYLLRRSYIEVISYGVILVIISFLNYKGLI